MVKIENITISFLRVCLFTEYHQHEPAMYLSWIHLFLCQRRWKSTWSMLKWGALTVYILLYDKTLFGHNWTFWLLKQICYFFHEEIRYSQVKIKGTNSQRVNLQYKRFITEFVALNTTLVLRCRLRCSPGYPAGWQQKKELGEWSVSRNDQLCLRSFWISVAAFQSIPLNKRRLIRQRGL